MTRFTLMPLLTFDQFEAAVPPLLEERPPPPALTCLCPGGSATRGDGAQRAGQSARPRRLRAGQDRSLGRQPARAGPHYITPDGEPPRRGDVRAEALTAVAQLLEVLAAVRSTMHLSRLVAGEGRAAQRELRLHRVFYNRKRRHSTLGMLSPVDYEKSTLLGDSDQAPLRGIERGLDQLGSLRVPLRRRPSRSPASGSSRQAVDAAARSRIVWMPTIPSAAAVAMSSSIWPHETKSRLFSA